MTIDDETVTTMVLTVMGCVFTVAFTLSKHAGFLLGIVLVTIIPILIYQLNMPDLIQRERRNKSIQLVLWLITCTGVMTHHSHLHTTTLDFADTFSQSVLTYHTTHGSYPQSYEVLGYDESVMKQYGVSYHYHKDTPPMLSYNATWIVFSFYTFDFKNMTWNYSP